MTQGKYVPGLIAIHVVVLVFVVLSTILVMYTLEKNQSGSATDASVDDRNDALKSIFQHFNKDGRGIGKVELTTIVKDLDPAATADGIEAMFTEANKAQINFAEFLNAVDSSADQEGGDGPDLTSGLADLIMQAQLATTKATAIGRLFLIIFLLYPTVTNKVFEGFCCREVGLGESILVADHDVHCTLDGDFTAEYTGLLVLCGMLVIAWPIGVPILLFVNLFAVRAKIQERDEATLKLFGSVVGDYDGVHWYWELVELARKLALTGLIGLLSRGSVAQTVAVSFVAAMFFGAYCWAQPFVASNLNLVKTCSEFLILAVLIVCIVHSNSKFISPDEFNMEEAITIDSYGTLQTAMCVMMVPTTIVFIFVQLQGGGREAKGDSPVSENEGVFANPLDEYM